MFTFQIEDTTSPRTIMRIAECLQNIAGDRIAGVQHDARDEEIQDEVPDNDPRECAADDIEEQITRGVHAEPEIGRGASAGHMIVGDDFLDSEGFPWDKRIHSSAKGMNKDGSWKYRKNIDKALIRQVEDELRQRQSEPAAVIPPVPGYGVPPVHVHAVPVSELAPSNHGVPPVHVHAVPVSELAPSSHGVPVTFVSVMTKITGAITAKKITHDQILAILQPQGVVDLPALNKRPDLLEYVSANIDAYLAR